MRLPAAALMAAILAATPAAAGEITIFAAASLQTALDAIVADWQAGTGNTAVVSYAGSPQLARQIEQGAPADIFISASVEWMDRLEESAAIDPATRLDLLGNRLVLVAPGEGAGEAGEIGPDHDFASGLNGGKLAMALVDSVPAGVYGKQALTSLDLWDDVEGDVAQADNVRAALALVAAQEAPLGIVYATDAKAEPGVHVVGIFPGGSHDPITYPAALVADSESAAAREFLDLLQGEAATAIFAAEGFSQPPARQ